MEWLEAVTLFAMVCVACGAWIYIKRKDDDDDPHQGAGEEQRYNYS